MLFARERMRMDESETMVEGVISFSFMLSDPLCTSLSAAAAAQRGERPSAV